MLRPRWRKVLADLWENKPRTALAVVSIAIGIFAVGMVVGAYAIIPSAMNDSYAGSNPANIVIRTDPFDSGLLKAMRRLDGVAEAEGQRTVNVRLRTESAGWVQLELVARSDLAATRVDHFLPGEGAAQPADRQALVVTKAADKYGLAVGQVLEIELADGTRRQLPLVGIVRDLTTAKRGFLNAGVGFVTDDTLEWLHEGTYFDRLYITVSERPSDKETIRQVAALVTDQLEKSGRRVYQTDLFQRNRHPFAGIVLALLNVLAALGVLLVFLGGSLIANTLSALINQQLRQIGVMKLVGARGQQVVAMYLTMVLALGAMALALTVVPASWAAYRLSAMVAGMINFTMPPASSFVVIPQAALAQVAMALLVPMAAGVLPVLQGARITVKKAIATSGLTHERIRGRAVQGRLRWLSRPLLISIRNTFRRKGRLALTLFTLALGGAIFVAVFNVRVGLDRTVERSMHYFRADVNLDLARLYRNVEVEQQLLSVPGVRRAEAWAAARGQVLRADGRTIGTVTILAPPADSDLVQAQLLAGRWLLPGDERAVAISEAFWAENPGLGPGDRLRLKIGDREDIWTVIGVFQFTGADELYAFANYDYLAGYLYQAGQSAMYRIVAEEHDLRHQEALGAEIDRRLRGLGYEVSKTEAGGSTAESASDLLSTVIRVLLILALLTAAVGSIGLAGTLSMNVMERTREIGVMRAIGAHDGAITQLVIVEGLVIGSISFVLAVLASFPITWLLSDLVTRAIFNTATSPAFTVQGYVIWLGVVAVLATVASAIPARGACRLTIREVLAYE